MANIEFLKLPDSPFGTLVRGLKHEHRHDSEVASKLRQAVMETSLLVCEDVALSPQEFVDVGNMFGKLSPLAKGNSTRIMDSLPEIFVVSNIIDSSGEPVGNYSEKDIWHTDHATRRLPSSCSLFYPRRLPENQTINQTSFCTTVNAHLLLPDALMARLRTATLYHDHEWYDTRYNPDCVYDPVNRELYPVQGHPIMRKMGTSKSICMYVSGSAGRYIIDSYGERHEYDFVEELIARLTIPERVYHHHYKPNELVVWSNHTAMHKPQPPLRRDQLVPEHHPNARLMHRVAVMGTEPAIPAFT